MLFSGRAARTEQFGAIGYNRLSICAYIGVTLMPLEGSAPMTQSRTAGTSPEFRARRRVTTLVAGLAALVVAAIVLPTGAPAQSNPGGTSSRVNPPATSDGQAQGQVQGQGQGRFEAPVGHRQPRPSDLPPGAAEDEGARTPEQRALDRSLQICRGC